MDSPPSSAPKSLLHLLQGRGPGLPRSLELLWGLLGLLGNSPGTRSLSAPVH